MLEIRELNHYFGGLQAVRELSFEVAGGLIKAIIGPNGAGKTTLFNLISGNLSPRSGSIVFNGQTIRGLPPHRIAALGISRTFQTTQLFQHMTVLENLIEAPVKVAGMNKDDAHKEAMKILATLQLADKADAWPMQLSGGQQQRVAIARALMMKPDVLLFDEPTAALDPEITNQIVQIINELSETGITQIVVTHEVDFAKKIASHVLYLEKGYIVEHGTKEAFHTPATPEFAEYLTH